MGRRVALLIAFGLGLGACASGTTNPVDDAEYDFAFADPAGDTAIATANPGSVKAPDLLQVSGRVDAKNLVVVLTFAEAITPWTAGEATALDGFLHFDTDTSTTTGFADPVHGLGVDFYLDLRDDGFGKAALVNVVKRSFVRVPVQFDGATFTVNIPRQELATESDGDGFYRLGVNITGRGRVPIADTSPTTGFHRLEPGAVP
ncbi:MAG: hypothetical protein ACKVZ0_13340 [Gemmatimonadales bacterium]